jgi:hypothetical protein
MSYCQGFCRTCGTGCAEYCAEIARWKAKAEDRGEKLEKALALLDEVSKDRDKLTSCGGSSSS